VVKKVNVRALKYDKCMKGGMEESIDGTVDAQIDAWMDRVINGGMEVRKDRGAIIQYEIKMPCNI
jgi:hypothetical protein